MPERCGESPVKIAVREGLHEGAALSVIKQNARRGQPIQIRSTRLGMTAETADPIIQVIHRNEEDVGLGGRSGIHHRSTEDTEDN